MSSGQTFFKMLPGPPLDSVRVRHLQSRPDYWDNEKIRAMIEKSMERPPRDADRIPQAEATAKIWTAIVVDTLSVPPSVKDPKPDQEPQRLEVDICQLRSTDWESRHEGPLAVILTRARSKDAPDRHTPAVPFLQVFCVGGTEPPTLDEARALADCWVPRQSRWEIREAGGAFILARGHRMSIFQWRPECSDCDPDELTLFPWYGGDIDHGYRCLWHDHEEVEQLMKTLRRRIQDCPIAHEHRPTKDCCVAIESDSE
ncbi:uncharacterized protein BO95DRAFT_510700 [Aspergillus brunneoviolaceus CBS 621.78]|uniref:Uncharacterized protein n=1 Tax=Aspergillus brunneoviolaceus CBS 621.78 TaxID=1450534 RepID=A0ACD1GN17_9EURO|nr:hypothetical protein BO95DRAFT_510700 [Aspergillus brunneoviolaceus CBS 621.78]RAH50645.1 hypothetical protein BO95DRAFT_510700 [Aspergillus brunneoviolaceus CBS 621.78]